MSIPAGEPIRPWAVERRAFTLAAVVALVMVLETQTFGAALFGAATWFVGVYVASLAAEVASLVLCAFVLLPDEMRSRLPRAAESRLPAEGKRSEAFYWAFALFVLALVLTAARVAYAAVDAIGTPTPFDLVNQLGEFE